MFLFPLGTLRHAVRIAMGGPLLWALALIPSLLPNYTARYATWPTCFLSVASIPVIAFVPLAIPSVVLHVHKGIAVSVSSTWQAIRGLWPRLLGLYALLLGPAICYGFALNTLLIGRSPQTSATWGVVLVKYALTPWLGAVAWFAFAGIAIHHLNAFRAFANSILIATNNILSLATLGATLAILSLLPQVILLFLQGGPSAAGRVVTTIPAFSTAGLSFLEYTLWSLLQAIAYLPISVLEAATWVLLYIEVTMRVAYPGITLELNDSKT